MTSKLDQSLDSIISSERSANSARGGRRGGRGGAAAGRGGAVAAANGSGPVRHGRTRAAAAAATPYQRGRSKDDGQRSKDVDSIKNAAGFSTPFVNSPQAHLNAAAFAALQQQQQQQLLLQQQQIAQQHALQAQKHAHQQKQQQAAAAAAAAAAGDADAAPQRKIVGDTIHVSNLEPDVSSDDVKEIFEKVGSIKSAVVNYSQNGVSMGTATVTFRRSADADRAVREYDKAEVDGKPMSIKLIGQLSTVPVVVKKRKPQPPQLPVAVQQQPQFGLGVGAGFGLPAAVAPQGGAAAFNPFAAGLAFPAALGGFPQQQFAGGFSSSFPQQQNRVTAAAPARGNARVNSGVNARGGAAAARGAPSAARGGRGAARGGRGAGGRGPVKEPTQSELDAELDAYQGSRADGESKTD